MTVTLPTGNVVTVASAEDVRLLVACLGQVTPESVLRAQVAAALERFEVYRLTGIVVNQDGRIVGEWPQASA